MNQPGITLLGLGPGDPMSLTRQAWELLNNIPAIHLRTRHHPAVAGFPAGLHVHSFDHYYDNGETYEQVYARIVDRVLELGRQPRGVVYGVPGHPFVAESTSPEILRRARLEGIPVRVVEGESFLGPVFTALEIDPFPQLSLVDALDLAAAHHPRFPPDIPAIIAQLHSPAVASEVKLTLMAVYPDEHPVKLVHAAGTRGVKVEACSLFEVDRSKHIGQLSTLYVPVLGKNTSFESFQEIVAHLRAPDGCPWDREQTHQSLRPHLLEEAYEVLSALDADDPQWLREELGDLLLQIVLHTQIAAEFGEFSMSEMLESVHAKLVRRHPHVFGDLKLKDKERVLMNWERLKATERQASGEGEKSLLDGVAQTLPALAQAEAYQKRAARVGFDWLNVQGVLDKVSEELEEARQATGSRQRTVEMGDLLFAVVNLARWYDVDAESALREANARFKRRFGHIEKKARERGLSLSDLSLEEMDALWDEAKLDSPGEDSGS